MKITNILFILLCSQIITCHTAQAVSMPEKESKAFAFELEVYLEQFFKEVNLVETNLLQLGKVNKKGESKFIEYRLKKRNIISVRYALNQPKWFPYGVCIEENNISNLDKKYMKKAINIWNTNYKNYYNTLLDKYKIIKSPLFVESCDYTKYVVILVKTSQIMSNQHHLGHYSHSCPKRDCNSNSDNILILWINKNVPEKMKIQTMLHELGHALSFPDPPVITKNESKIMSYCKEKINNKWNDIPLEDCILENTDFDYMLNIHLHAFNKFKKISNRVDFNRVDSKKNKIFNP